MESRNKLDISKWTIKDKDRDYTDALIQTGPKHDQPVNPRDF